jgi:hypothetical protein
MLGLKGEIDRSRRDCFELCGPALRLRILQDLERFQASGLAGLGEDQRLAMLERYTAFEANPYAIDIAEWLRGGYAFDPACLTA